MSIDTIATSSGFTISKHVTYSAV